MTSDSLRLACWIEFPPLPIRVRNPAISLSRKAIFSVVLGCIDLDALLRWKDVFSRFEQSACFRGMRNEPIGLVQYRAIAPCLFQLAGRFPVTLAEVARICRYLLDTLRQLPGLPDVPEYALAAGFPIWASPSNMGLPQVCFGDRPVNLFRRQVLRKQQVLSHYWSPSFSSGAM
ncbi:hypothetical protein [Sinorhizobium medicae]|uniref:hypothetical protein n=1 Tax=Sinorhizobium medicae TaxID=110321 RepID=UPI001FB1FB80|nr:hypothetical protein [Sinorhizobium medicae]